MKPGYVLRLSCADRSGIVAGVAGCLAELGCFITRSRSYGDPDTGRFFLRTAFRLDDGQLAQDIFAASFADGFARVASRFDMDWSLSSADARVKTLIMLSKNAYCANALLYGARMGDLAIEPVGLVSNHASVAGELAHWDVPFSAIEVSRETKQDAEARLFSLIEETGAELIVLARYMQILTQEACARLAGRCINIHHSFLPSFKGARAYHQAHGRGVKMIGATAHYVTPDLDEGPIIAQSVEAVDHTHTADDLVAIGRHLEATTLVRAVKAHGERRVFINGSKTVVFG